MVSEQPGRPEPPGPYGIGSDTWPGLATLAADAAEVLHLARTIMATGDDADGDPASLRESLQQELGDLRAAIDYVIGKNALDWTAVNRRRDRKRSRYDRAAPQPRPTAPTRAAIPGPRGPADEADAGSCDQEADGPGQSGLRQHARPPRAVSGRSARSRTRTRASAAT